MRTKRAFVPSALGRMDRLEDRVVLSHAAVFSHGAAVLTTHAMNKTLGEVQHAFARFATHGQDFNRLQNSLISALGRMPYHKVDGLDAAARDAVSQLRSDMASGADRPVISAYQGLLATVRDQVAARVADGSVVRR